MNMGKVGGAGEEHIHFHIVPRWTGDTNFMPVLGETKIIPEYLEKTYQKLHPAFEDLFRERKRPKRRAKEMKWVKTLFWMIIFIFAILFSIQNRDEVTIRYSIQRITNGLRCQEFLSSWSFSVPFFWEF